MLSIVSTVDFMAASVDLVKGLRIAKSSRYSGKFLPTYFGTRLLEPDPKVPMYMLLEYGTQKDRFVSTALFNIPMMARILDVQLPEGLPSVQGETS